MKSKYTYPSLPLTGILRVNSFHLCGFLLSFVLFCFFFVFFFPFDINIFLSFGYHQKMSTFHLICRYSNDFGIYSIEFVVYRVGCRLYLHFIHGNNFISKTVSRLDFLNSKQELRCVNEDALPIR